MATANAKVNVVLVIFNDRYGDHRLLQDWNLSWDALLNNLPSLRNQSRHRVKAIFDSPEDYEHGRLSMFTAYAMMLAAQNESSSSSEGDLVRGLLLILTLYTNWVEQDFDQKRVFFRLWNTEERGELHYAKNGDEELYENWKSLREYVDAFDTFVRASSRYMTRQFGQDGNIEELKELKNWQREILIQAQALETKMRDTLQVQVGRLSLEESRKSIEEGKRVKLRESSAASKC